MTKLFRKPAVWAVSAAASGMALLGSAMANLPPADQIAFSVFRGDSPIGHHRLSFEKAGEDLLVNVDIELKVKFAMFTLYDYKHRSQETWRDGRLVGLDTKTNDNGDKFFVRAAATQDGLSVESTSGAYVAPADILPTSYWRSDTVDQSKLLNTQDGRLLEVAVEKLGEEPVRAGDREIPAKRFRFSGDLELELWYGESAEWLRTRFEARGAEIDYTLEPGTLAAYGLLRN